MQRISVMVEGGKATAGPPLGPALGPLGIPAGKVVGEINQKTAKYKGLQVPVVVKVNPATKDFEVEVGMPLTSALIKEAINLDKGSGDGATVADISWDQVIEVAKKKQEACLGSTLQKIAKEVVGTCKSMGITIDGKPAEEFLEDVPEVSA